MQSASGTILATPEGCEQPLLSFPPRAGARSESVMSCFPGNGLSLRVLLLILATLTGLSGLPGATADFAAAEEGPDAATRAAKSSDSQVRDVTNANGPAPGSKAVESLRRSVTVPSAGERWRGLSEFGRDLFLAAAPGASESENTPVGPDYVLGPGDNVMVFLSGLTDASHSLTLDREGKVFLPRVGSTYLWGLSFADAEALIRDRLGTIHRDGRVQVSMGRLRALEVLALGAVTKPGRYTLTGLATAFNALTAAGGPSSLGSLRDIRVLRANQEIGRLDLYPFLLAGDRSNDLRLQAGDVLFVGLAKTRVGIQGAVIRPAVYEGHGPLSLRALLDMAGGASPYADLTRIRVERVDANGGFRLQDLPLDHGHGIDPDSLLLYAYDLVTVLPLNERVKNLVTLDGFVRHPGEYELTPGMKLSQLVTHDRLLPEASLEQAELRRVHPETFQVEVRSISMVEVWAGREDLVLQPLDAVSIYSSARLPRSVLLEGEVARPGTYAFTPGDRLSSLLERAGGVTAQGHLAGAVFMRRSAAVQARAHSDGFVQRERMEMARHQVALAQSGDTTALAALERANAELLATLGSQADPGRVVLDLDSKKWIGSAKDPVLEDGDRLVVPLRPATVAVLGNVMNPGTLMARRGARFDTYVKLAGGTSRQADLGRSYVLKANGEAIPRRSSSHIEAGDAIVVPARVRERSGLGRVLGGGGRLALELLATAAVVVAATR
jgi:polysaccharide export outer membrane protein